MVEHMSEEHGVGGSIPPSSTRNRSSVVEHSADNRAVTSSNLVGSTLVSLSPSEEESLRI